MRLRTAGGPNEDLFAIIAANSRNPVEVKGDLRSLVSCNDTGAARLRDMMREFDLARLDALADHVLAASEAATRRAIGALPDGRYAAEMTLDGYEAPIRLKARLDVEGEQVRLDYAGSSPASRYGINSPKCYTDAYSVFGLKCVIAPDVPNNAGRSAASGWMRRPARASPPSAPRRSPRGTSSARCCRTSCSAASPRRSRPDARGERGFHLGARHVERGGRRRRRPAGRPRCAGRKRSGDARGDGDGPPAAGEGRPSREERRPSTRFNLMNVGLGGVGAGPAWDGLNTTAFPSGVGAIPVEVTESESPLLYRRKELLPDSGGPGRFRGGLSQIHRDREHRGRAVPGVGRHLGPPSLSGRGPGGRRIGRAGSARLGSGPPLEGKARHRIPAGDTLGRGAAGRRRLRRPARPPRRRPRSRSAAGYVTPDGARRHYRKG